jgi:hypothetical protein
MAHFKMINMMIYLLKMVISHSKPLNQERVICFLYFQTHPPCGIFFGVSAIAHLQQRSHAAAREHMDDRPPAVWPRRKKWQTNRRKMMRKRMINMEVCHQPSWDFEINSAYQVDSHHGRALVRNFTMWLRSGHTNSIKSTNQTSARFSQLKSLVGGVNPSEKY